jgi:hypothetical protein
MLRQCNTTHVHKGPYREAFAAPAITMTAIPMPWCMCTWPVQPATTRASLSISLGWHLDASASHSCYSVLLSKVPHNQRHLRYHTTRTVHATACLLRPKPKAPSTYTQSLSSSLVLLGRAQASTQPCRSLEVCV